MIFSSIGVQFQLAALLSRGMLQSFMLGGSSQRSNPFNSLAYHFDRNGTSFVYLLWKKGTPFQVPSTQEHCISFLKPRNKVNESCISAY